MKIIYSLKILIILGVFYTNNIFSQSLICTQSYHPSNDAWVWYLTDQTGYFGATNSSNYSNNQFFRTEVWTYNSTPGIIRSYIKFNLPSNINTHINIAKLYLYNSQLLEPIDNIIYGHSSNVTNKYAFYMVNSDWSETNITWNNQPSIDYSDSVISNSLSGTIENFSFEDLVIDLSEVILNNNNFKQNFYGINIRCHEESISSQYRKSLFISRKYHNSNYWPKLEVEYNLSSPNISFNGQNTFQIVNNEVIETIFDNINYEWTVNGFVYYGNTINPIEACLYNVSLKLIITNNSGNTCEYYLSEEYEISESGLTITPKIKNVICKGKSTGSISIEISGGVEPYSIMWSNNNRGNTISYLSKGMYYVTVTDANNCSTTKEYEILEPEYEITLNSTIKDALCYGHKNGSILLEAYNGTAPYTYNTNKDTVTYFGSFIDKIGAGEYSVLVKDINGCTAKSKLFIKQPPKLYANCNLVYPSCIGKMDGIIEINISGGVRPYTFNFANNLISDSIITGLSKGHYNIEIYDLNNCYYNLGKITLEDNFIDCLNIPNAFSPNDDGINDMWIIQGIEDFPEAIIEVYNQWGQILYNSQDSNTLVWNGKFNNKHVPTGSYLYEIKLNNYERKYSGTVTVVY